MDFRRLAEEGRDRGGFLLEGLEPLHDGLLVVIRAATGLTTPQQPLLHHLLRTFQIDTEVERHHLRLECGGLPHGAREAVQQECLLPTADHRILQHVAPNDVRNQTTLLHHVCTHLAQLAARGHLRAEQVTRGEMVQAILGHQLFGKSAFSAARTTEDDNSNRILGK